MPGTHQHCACNGVLLCPTCHSWTHAHPFLARQAGMIVSRHTDHPGSVPVVGHYGTLILKCDGKATYDLGDEP